MNANPVLVTLKRGNAVENIHRGAIAVAKGDGEIVASTGDVERPVFPRSAIKAMQALALFEAGAADRYRLDDRAIALACASHYGEREHVEGVQRLLDLLGLSVGDLECGAHPPSDARARQALAEQGTAPSALHNNCSGKHAGMLAEALALGLPTHGYVKREHPVQQLVRRCVEDVLGEQLSEDRCGTDGCSIPTWAAPLRAFATGFACMATGEGLSAERAAAARRVFDAATANPFLIRGTDSLDTDLMLAFKGRLMIKIGAEGVFCGALRDRGLGFALKIDDGNTHAAEVAVAGLLLALADATAGEKAALEQYATRKISNWRKIVVGEMAPTDAVALRPPYRQPRP